MTNHLELGKSPVTLDALISSVVIRKEKEVFQSVAFTTGSRFVTIAIFLWRDIQWSPVSPRNVVKNLKLSSCELFLI